MISSLWTLCQTCPSVAAGKVTDNLFSLFFTVIQSDIDYQLRLSSNNDIDRD